MKVLVLGCTGMLGHTLFTHLSSVKGLDVYATARSSAGLSLWFPPELLNRIVTDVDACSFDTITRAVSVVKPDIVINCIGLIKQLPLAEDPLSAITINAQLPHRISLLCSAAGVRLIHISTDCVYNGKKGNYTEHDPSDADDLYGRSKYLGEVDYPHCVTLRTSIIGHELKGKYGLIEWFLSQNKEIRGYTKALFSGFPTIELAIIISEYVLFNAGLRGIYHLSSHPITKYHLLKLVAQKYAKNIIIEPYDDFSINRTLDSTVFRTITGYSPPSWPELVDKMYNNYMMTNLYKN